ncbi:lysophospholipase L1-like esterase [Micromonospora pisi]|uniref:Lysophospholipase L1-like esterase n=1 Tax=Micromonospora pisi TaxID=589240 RepID=A0A495JN61_9ACTN|nr:SGNH/GDSL hydrolase family protein [Micromonospora pisi]RKR90251.1 lysophospholipase L1-like esterase [Micromonospora pisi]
MSTAGSVARERAPWRRARRIAKLTIIGAGVTAATTVAAWGVLIGQARQARRVIPLAEAPPPRGDGVYGARFPGKPLTMVILGDSSAAGYGVHRPRETPGALLATGVSRRLRRPVRLHRYAVVGSRSAGLAPQVEAALEQQPDLAVILVGGNDVTARTPLSIAVRYLVDAVRELRGAGAQVVVGTCPDLGAIRPIKPPLRWLARRWSRQLAAAQTVAVVEAGGATVSLGDLLGPRFAAEPARMFAWDRFHPSAEGYAVAAAALLPTVLMALGVTEEQRPPLAAGEGVRSLPAAAHEAARNAGTEVSGAEVGGRERGPAGRWAQLRRRRAWFGHQRGEEPAARGPQPTARDTGPTTSGTEPAAPGPGPVAGGPETGHGEKSAATGATSSTVEERA